MNERMKLMQMRKIKTVSTVTFEQVAAALDQLAGGGTDHRERNARALGHAEVLLWQALFQSADEWTRVRQLILNIIEGGVENDCI